MSPIRRLQDASAEDVVPGLLGAWAGILWALFTLVTSLIWDLDASWYDVETVSLPVLIIRIVLYWPIWATVQIAEGLEWTGLDLGVYWAVVAIMVGAATAACIGLVGSSVASRRAANGVDRTAYPR